jgi:hypothetical protein
VRGREKERERERERDMLSDVEGKKGGGEIDVVL